MFSIVNKCEVGETSESDRRPTLVRAGFASLSHWIHNPSSDARTLIVSAVVTAILMGVLFIRITPGYETNDDLCMQLIASGFYDGHPSEYLVFTSFLIGWPLRLLFSVCSSWNWYLTYLVAVQYAAMTAICFVVLRRGRRWLTLVLFMGFFCLVQFRMLVDLQFTTTAFFVGAAGILLTVEGLSKREVPKWSQAAVGLVFIAAAAAIREAVVPFLFIVATPFLVERIRSIDWIRTLGAAVAIGSVILCLRVADRWYYQGSPAWSEFRAYNELRGQIQDTPLTNAIPKVAAAVGWSRNDGELFRRFYFAEPEVYASTAKLRLLLLELQAASPVDPGLLKRQFMKCIFLPRGFPRDSAFFMKLALLNAVLCLLFAGRSVTRYGLALLASYGVFVVLSIYLRTTARLPERVAFSMPLFMTLMCLYWGAEAGVAPTSCDVPAIFGRFLPTLAGPCAVRWVLRLCLAISVLLYIPFLFHFSEGWWYCNVFNRKVHAASRTMFQPMANLMPTGCRPLIVPMPSDSSFVAGLTYARLEDATQCSMVPYGWLTHSPIFQSVLSQHHLQPFSLSLLDRDDVFFLMNDSWRASLQTFYRERYGKGVEFAVVRDSGQLREYRDGGLRLYRAYSDRGPGEHTNQFPTTEQREYKGYAQSYSRKKAGIGGGVVVSATLSSGNFCAHQSIEGRHGNRFWDALERVFCNLGTILARNQGQRFSMLIREPEAQSLQIV